MSVSGVSGTSATTSTTAADAKKAAEKAADEAAEIEGNLGEQALKTPGNEKRQECSKHAGHGEIPAAAAVFPFGKDDTAKPAG